MTTPSVSATSRSFVGMKGRQEPRLANLPAFHTSDGAGVGNIIRVAGMEPNPHPPIHRTDTP